MYLVTKKRMKGFYKIGMWVKNAVISLIVSALLFSCTGDIEYTVKYKTNCDQQKLINVKNKKLLILSFDENSGLIKDADFMDSSIVNTIKYNQKASLISELGTLFSVIDATKDFSLYRKKAKPCSDSALIANYLKKSDAEGGILITNAYGLNLYEASTNTSVKDGLEDSIGKRILPKKLNKFLDDPKSIQFYYFASNTFIYDDKGKIIWNFYGKTYAAPKPLEGLNPVELLRSAFWMDPSPKRLFNAYQNITNHYNNFLIWLLKADMQKSKNKNYFTDYPKNLRDKRVFVFPAADTLYQPLLSKSTK